MKCPLFVMARLEAGAPQETNLTDCLKEECAWWMLTMNCCAVVTLALHSGDIWDKLAKISDKMPHAGQFTK